MLQRIKRPSILVEWNGPHQDRGEHQACQGNSQSGWKVSWFREKNLTNTPIVTCSWPQSLITRHAKSKALYSVRDTEPIQLQGFREK